MVKIAREISDEIFEMSRDASNRILNYVASYTFPVYRNNSQGVPEMVGSGSLIKFRGMPFFITAGHVFDLREDDVPLYYYVAEDKVEYLDRAYETTAFSLQNREDDELDIAVIIVNPSNGYPANNFQNKFIPYDMILENSSEINDVRHYLVGYPLTRNRVVGHEPILNPTALLWEGGMLKDEAYKKTHLDKEKHILVRFKETNVVNAETGEGGMCNLKPRGISGGGAWAGFGQRDNMGVLQIEDVRLIGVITTHRPEVKAIQCTRIDVALKLADQLLNRLLETGQL